MPFSTTKLGPPTDSLFPLSLPLLDLFSPYPYLLFVVGDTSRDWGGPSTRGLITRWQSAGIKQSGMLMKRVYGVFTACTLNHFQPSVFNKENTLTWSGIHLSLEPSLCSDVSSHFGRVLSPALMDFELYLSYSITLRLSSTSSSINSGEPTDDSNPLTKHWRLVAVSNTGSQRIIELSTPDQKQIELRNHEITMDLLPSNFLYHVANFTGDEEDFARVIEHHPMRGGQYSSTYNNCQHFVTMFLILLNTLADETPEKSFRPQPRYGSCVKSVMSSDNEFLWNKPNVVLEFVYHGARGLLAAVKEFARLAATRVVQVPAPGVMGWLGVTTTVPALPWASTASVASSLCGIGFLVVEVANEMWWKSITKIRHPRMYGFPQ